MTRYVHNASMVAHLWANRSQDSARSNNGNFYFEGPTLYSYGSHFVVGFHLPFSGPTLLNSDTYSVSTSGHCSDARRAVSGVFFYVPRLTELRNRLNRYNMERKEVKAVIRNYCGEMLKEERGLSDHALRGLLSYAGLESSFDKLKRESARIIAARIAKEKRAARDSAIRYLKDWQERESGLYSYMESALIRAGQYRDTDSIIGESTTRIRKAQRTLGKAGTPPRLWQASQRILKALADMTPALDKGRGAAYQRAVTRGLVRSYRSHMERLPVLWLEAVESPSSGPLDLLAQRLYELTRTLENIGVHVTGGIPAPIRDKAKAAVALVGDIQYQVRQTQVAARNAEYAEREALRLQSIEESRAAFFAGEPSLWRGSTESGSCYIRALDVKRNESGEITGGELHTSHGARVPLRHAIRAFRFVKLIREQNNARPIVDAIRAFDEPIAWQRNGERVRVGSFELDSIYANGSFVAGCHRIAWPEIEALARQLGVFDLPASREAATHD